MKNFLAVVLSVLLGLFAATNASAQHTVASIPNPKLMGSQFYVSDPDGNLSADVRAELNRISGDIEQATESEFAIVVVDDYVGGNDFDFAMDLFSHWGIGKKGSNNGLLLFLSMDSREFRFLTGYGVEGIFSDALLNQIGHTYLVPYMRAGNTDMAVLATAKAVQSVFLSPTHQLELAALQAYRPTFWNKHQVWIERLLAVAAVFVAAFYWLRAAEKKVFVQFRLRKRKKKGHPVLLGLALFLLAMFLSMFPILFGDLADQVYRAQSLPWFAAVLGGFILLCEYYGTRAAMVKSTRDAKNALDAESAYTRLSLVPLLLSPFTYFSIAGLGKQRKLARLRDVPPALPGDWSRLHRDRLKSGKLNTYLTEQQRAEEKLKSKSYEIWLDSRSGQTHLIAFEGRSHKQYEICPSCQGKTLGKPTDKTIKAATYSSTGTAERIQACEFCDYRKSLGIVVLAKLSDSSSSGGSSGGGGGGSSGGSSFGGGSSGGGGAGGRW